jgi:hypothetical protein
MTRVPHDASTVKAMFRVRHAHFELRHPFQVQVECLTGMGQGFGQRLTARDDVGKSGKSTV